MLGWAVGGSSCEASVADLAEIAVADALVLNSALRACDNVGEFGKSVPCRPLPVHAPISFLFARATPFVRLASRAPASERRLGELQTRPFRFPESTTHGAVVSARLRFETQGPSSGSFMGSLVVVIEVMGYWLLRD